MPSSGMLRRVAVITTEVSEEGIASIIKVTRIGELGTALAVTSNRRTLSSPVRPAQTSDNSYSCCAGLLAVSQFASRRFWDRPARSRFSVLFLSSRANAELVPKFQIALLCMLHMQPSRWYLRNFRLNIALKIANQSLLKYSPH
jgi:hypothetical protein